MWSVTPTLGYRQGCFNPRWLGVHHSPDVCHVQHALSKAGASMAAKQWAVAKALATAEETLNQVQERAQSDTAQPERRGPGRPPKAVPSLARAEQEVEAARQQGIDQW